MSDDIVETPPVDKTTDNATLISNVSKTGLLIVLGVTITVGILGSIFSPSNTVPILGFCSVISVSLFGEIRRITTDTKSSKKLDAVAEKAEAVKNSLDTTESRASADRQHLKTVVIDTQKTMNTVHSLVNSSMTAQLKISMIALKRVAQVTGNPEDAAAAELAEKAFNEHEARQANLDIIAADPPSAKPTLVTIVQDKPVIVEVDQHKPAPVTVVQDKPVIVEVDQHKPSPPSP